MRFGFFFVTALNSTMIINLSYEFSSYCKKGVLQ